MHSATEFQPHSELQVVSNLLKALQTRINILNRIRPWCKVGAAGCPWDIMSSTAPCTLVFQRCHCGE
jgi:hypothetical protein